jgi:hypothetical protein
MRRIAVLLALVATPLTAPAQDANRPAPEASRLAAARALVEKSDRYLHHSKLKRGMKGYGLSVLKGTEIEKFDFEIVSVVGQFNTAQDAVLAKLSSDTYDFEKAGIISGMSGSPMYVRDPADGKFKMIGALAFGWNLSKEPLTGIQPITHMLSISGVLDEAAEDNTTRRAASKSARTLTDKQLTMLLRDGTKRDFAKVFTRAAATRRKADATDSTPRLTPLRCPLLIAGMSDGAARRARRLFAGANLMPVQAGRVGGKAARDLKEVKLEPGSSVSVPLVSGDADWYAIGTVTEVIDDHVLAFGHAFYGEGKVDYPMANAYVHTVVKSLSSSFKLGSSGVVLGGLKQDAYVGILGKTGNRPKMIPVTVTVRDKRTDRVHKYEYEVVKEYWFTPTLLRAVIVESVLAWHNPPLQHHTRYKVRVDYDKLPSLTAENRGSNDSGYDAASDVTRVVYALTNNHYHEPIFPEKVSVELTVSEGNIGAGMVTLKLDGETYEPGETVTGSILLRRYRKERTRLDVKFKLPKDMDEGTYTLTAMDYLDEISADRRTNPHRYAARKADELVSVARRVVQPRATTLYMQVLLPEGGLAIHRQNLPDLPESKAALLRQAQLPDTYTTRRRLVQTQKTKYVLNGNVSARFTVRKTPEKTPTHKQEKRP